MNNNIYIPEGGMLFEILSDIVQNINRAAEDAGELPIHAFVGMCSTGSDIGQGLDEFVTVFRVKKSSINHNTIT